MTINDMMTLDLFVWWLEKNKKHSSNGGLMVIYFGLK